MGVHQSFEFIYYSIKLTISTIISCWSQACSKCNHITDIQLCRDIYNYAIFLFFLLQHCSKLSYIHIILLSLYNELYFYSENNQFVLPFNFLVECQWHKKWTCNYKSFLLFIILLLSCVAFLFLNVTLPPPPAPWVNVTIFSLNEDSGFCSTSSGL